MPARDVAPGFAESNLPPIVAAIRERVGATRFDIWFRTRTVFELAKGQLTIHAPNDGFRDWLEETFGDAVRQAAAGAIGATLAVRFEVSPNRFDEDGPVAAKPQAPEPVVAPKPKPTAQPQAMPKPRETLFGPELPPPPKPGRAKKTKPVETPKEPEPTTTAATPRTARRWRTLSDFVVGSCNRLAHASVQSILEGGDDAPNPLVIHGPVGTGKTHLLEALHSGWRGARPSEKPIYVTAEEFTTRFVQASRFEKHEQFRRQFRDAPALLIDDLHFLASKPGTQRELLHTLDSLTADGRPIIVTMDCHPRLSDDLLPELTDRLLGGGVWGLLPPDDETRLAVLRAKAGGATPAIPDAVLKLVAKGLRGNVRELEGAVNSIRHYARVTGRPVDATLAREALGEVLRHSVRGVSLVDVDAAVVAALDLPTNALQSKARSWAVTHPRAVAVYLCRKHTAATYGEIAKHFAVKTHSTAVAAEKRVASWLTKSEVLVIGDRRWPVRELLDRIERELMK